MIRDQTLGIPSKAWILSDQDCLTHLMDKSSLDTKGIDRLFGFFRTAYQCESCGRICIDDPATKRLIWFLPEAGVPEWAFAPIHGKGFPIRLTGDWSSTYFKGRLYWNEAGDVACGEEFFDDQGALQKRYFAMLEQLKESANLVHARLLEDGSPIHTWTKDDNSG